MATALPSGTPIASGDDSENTTSSTTMPPISTDDETGSADWFNKTCAVKSQGTHDHTGKMSAAFHAVMISADRLWDTKETLTYTFLNGSSVQHDKVNNTITEWMTYANIKFSYSLEKGATIRISFDSSNGSWSYVGTDIKSIDPEDPTMNLGWIDATSPAISASDRGTILHEFGHVLGLLHEHQSPNRGSKIHLKEEAVTAFYTSKQGWSKELVKSQIIDVYNTWDLSNYSELDTKSIMMYFMPAAMNKENLDVPPNHQLSPLDKAYISINYPHDPNTSTMSFQEALDIAKVDLSTQTNLKYLYVRKEYHVLRHKFSDWSLSRFMSSSPSGPSHDISSPVTSGPSLPIKPQHASPSPTQNPTEGDFLPVLVQSLKKFFPSGGNQIFSLQFPGRFLQKSLYAWDTSAAGHYGQVVKPLSVNESEFRLTDQMYDISPVVGGPNGVNLSLVYEQVLNNLIPASHDVSLRKQQDRIRKWLLTDVKTAQWIKKLLAAQHSKSTETSNSVGKVIGGPQPMFAVSEKMSENHTVNRLELSEALMQEYLVAKQTWEAERDLMINKATKLKLGSSESSEALNELTRTLAHVTATREAQLASKYADAVVRGFSHTIREYMGHLDIKSSAEFLQDAKDSLREAAMSSFDGSMKVYPVQMTPIDWFESLSTSFTMEDLTSDVNLIEEQINAKSKQLDVLNSQLAALKTAKRGDIKALEEEVKVAQAKLDSTQSDLASVYSTNVISMARTAIDNVGRIDKVAFATVTGKLNIVDPALTDLRNGIEKVAAAQQALTSASRVYTQALASLALAEATDTQQQQQEIQLQITSLNKNVEELTTRFRALKKPTSTDPPTDPPTNPPTDSGTTPSPPLASIALFPKDVTSGGSRWQEIKLEHHFDKNTSTQKDGAYAGSERAKTDPWLGSYERNSSVSGAMFGSTTSASRYTVQFGLRATMVTVDRGGWFQPQFFKQSRAFHHVSRDVTWSKWPDNVKSMNDLKSSASALEELNKNNLLPGFPVGYIICKDITIKISSSESFDEVSRTNMKQSFVKSGGCFCFSMSSSETGSSNENTHNFTSCSDGLVVRIPGPQILGYMIQLTENDSTKPLSEATGKELYISDADYDTATSDMKPTPARTINMAGPDPQLLDQINAIIGSYKVPDTLVNSIRDDIKGVVVKELTSGMK